ncbi:hypothetical protein EV682_104174 [Iodobacter fluviatilis]|uniref:Uncharacterized protein n=1 Tax=Iodobacter fluviatilis TaxID=537 RepID=A0A377SYU8_9NEIS|nr:hypothetical protein EV682_104174 [Iodobacter fluviatilis]STR45506.1 Uncharacterised protein [Iodobacter fluviatilis]
MTLVAMNHLSLGADAASVLSLMGARAMRLYQTPQYKQSLRLVYMIDCFYTRVALLSVVFSYKNEKGRQDDAASGCTITVEVGMPD